MTFPAYADPGALRCPAGHVELTEKWSNATTLEVFCHDCETTYQLPVEDV